MKVFDTSTCQHCLRTLDMKMNKKYKRQLINKYISVNLKQRQKETDIFLMHSEGKYFKKE